jgi:hypothetical protein
MKSCMLSMNCLILGRIRRRVRRFGPLVLLVASISVHAQETATKTLSFTVNAPSTPSPSGALLTGCTVNGSNVPSCSTPSGWTLVMAQGFESGSLGTGQSFYGGSNTETIDTTEAHTGTHSMDTYVEHSYQGVGMILAGSAINSNHTYVSMWQYVQIANPGYGVEYTDWSMFDRKNANTDLNPDWQCAAQNGCDPAEQSEWAQGASGTGFANWAVYGPEESTGMGVWTQWEWELRGNDPGQTNGFEQLFKNGVLVQRVDSSSSRTGVCSGTTFTTAAPWSCGNLNGNNSIATIPLFIGGDWGAVVPGTGANQNMSACVGGNGLTAAQVCPPNGSIPFFHIYIDDVIVLKQ